MIMTSLLSQIVLRNLLNHRISARPYCMRSEFINDESEITLTTDQDDNHVYIMTMNSVAKRNSLSHSFISLMEKSLQNLRDNHNCKVMILRSSLDKVFCAGADLKERLKMSNQEVENFVDRLRRLTNDIQFLPFPTIAAINGFALGGGLEMALACDLRVASGKARMGLVETTLAIIPGAGGTQRLSRIIGLSRAKDLIFTGKVVNSHEAYRIGLVDYVDEKETSATTGEDRAMAKSLTLARELTRRGPISLRMAKLAVDKGFEVDLQTGLAIEKACYLRVINSQDRIEGLKAFTEKRDAKYKGE